MSAAEQQATAGEESSEQQQERQELNDLLAGTGGKESKNNNTPARDYLEANVVHVLLQGLRGVCRERPENPIDYLGMYLLKKNPNKNTVIEVPLTSTTDNNNKK